MIHDTPLMGCLRQKLVRQIRQLSKSKRNQSQIHERPASVSAQGSSSLSRNAPGEEKDVAADCHGNAGKRANEYSSSRMTLDDGPVVTAATAKGLTASMRGAIENHRENPNCAKGIIILLYCCML